MFNTVDTLGGIGLAAPQLCENLATIVYCFGKERGCLINPEIESTGAGFILAPEGCLSFPGISVKIKRYSKIKVKAYDTNLKPIEMELDGLFARVIQHEVDHLLGKTFIDKISRIQKDIVIRKIHKIKKGLERNKQWKRRTTIA